MQAKPNPAGKPTGSQWDGPVSPLPHKQPIFKPVVIYIFFQSTDHSNKCVINLFRRKEIKPVISMSRSLIFIKARIDRVKEITF